ncbi:fatty acid desaturase [Sinorhizobium meliloti]|nr:fatty acid desaturase [Sinorhizobium meliloti]MDX0212039.1 fatty acid desaturase [Sinorhizobium meliloti]
MTNIAELRRSLRAYRKPSNHRALFECIVTLGPLLACWTITFSIARQSIAAALFMTPITSAFLVRTFLIQHDCGHHSFFSQRWMNDWLGRIVGVLTFTPYEYWRRGHSLHHAHSGNLAKRGFWDVPMLTVRQYEALRPAKRWAYRLVRHPLILFGVGPFYLFVIHQRLPFGQMRTAAAWVSALGTNLAVALMLRVLGESVGYITLAAVATPVLVLTSTIGVWLFFVQHYYEHSHFSQQVDWSFGEAALHGSSLYILPEPFMWLTADIGIHHIHHLDSRIPFYRLRAALNAHPELRSIGRVTIRDSTFCLKRILWDSDKQVFVRPN